MKSNNQQKTQIGKIKRKKNRSRSQPKSYYSYFVHRSSFQGLLNNSLNKNSLSQPRKMPMQSKRQSLDEDPISKSDASSSRSRQIKSNKQNKNALQKAEIQKFTQIISSLNELFSKTLLPIDLYQQLTQQLTEINQSGLTLIKSKANDSDDQDENSDIFVETWNSFINTFQNFLKEPVKNQLITFFSSHVNSIQDVINNIANCPPTNLNFIPQWSSILLQFNASIKDINNDIINFKKQNENDIRSNMPIFSNLLLSFQLMLNDTKLFKLSSLSMSKREESHFIISKSIVRMIKYSEGFSKNQFTNGIENSLNKAIERINSFIPQLHQLFSTPKNDEKSQLILKKLTKNTTSSLGSNKRSSLQKNGKNLKKVGNNNNSKKENTSNSTKEINEATGKDDIDDQFQEIIGNDTADNNLNNNEIKDSEGNINQDNANDNDEIDNEDENDNNNDNEPTVSFQLKSARKYNKIFKKKLETTLQEEEALNNEITELTSALESSRKLLRNLKLTRNQTDAVQRRNEAIKNKAEIEKQLDSLRSEASRLEDHLRSKKDEHEQFLLAKKELDEVQIENEYIKTIKKNAAKYLRRLKSITKVTNSNIYVSDKSSSLLSPVSITTTQANQQSSTFDQATVDAVKKFQDEFETVKTEYEKLIKERTILSNNDNADKDNIDNQTLLKIYYDAQRFQQQNQTLQNELQAAQLRNISITKETNIDSFFKSFLQSKKRELKELEQVNGEILNNNDSTSNQTISKLTSLSQLSKKLSQSSFFDKNTLLGRNDFDPLESVFVERSRLQQEYHHLQPGPQEETKSRRISIKAKLSKFPPIPEEYVQLDEATESLIFTRSQLKNAIESNFTAADSLNEAIFMRDETEISKMIARKRLDLLHIEFPIDMKIESRSKRKFIAEQEKKKLEEAKRKEEEEEEEEEDSKTEEESEKDFNYTDDERKEEPKEEKIKKDQKITNSNSGFKINFNFSAFGSKNKSNNQSQSPSTSSNLVDITKKDEKTENTEDNNNNVESNDKDENNDNVDKNDITEKAEEEEEEENEEEEDTTGLVTSLIRLRQVNSERVEMEEKLRALEEMFMTLFGDRIPPKVTLSLTDKIELVMRQFNKTK
ncbi:hypothetical protein M9Y10_011441 [Tritrichomonas musculus]|uniref:Uncharacterized protein n=1 Tax=Tritrichomonas musculus TaxID=1915356 RepID=A0ABR2IKJ2_9EUKA